MATAEQECPTAARATVDPRKRGPADLGPWVVDRVPGGDGDGRDCPTAAGAGAPLCALGLTPHAEGRADSRQQHRRYPGIAGGGGMELVEAEEVAGPGLELGTEQIAQGDGPATRLDDCHGLCGGQVAAPAPHEVLERHRDRFDRPQIRAGANNDFHA